MKKTYKYIWGLMMALVLLGCQREEDIIVATLTYSNDTINAKYYTADVTCALHCNAPYKYAFIHYATNADFADFQYCVMPALKKGTYAVSLTELEPDMTYYVRFEVSNSVSNLLTEQYCEFHTMPLSAPVLTTVYDSIFTYNSATVGGHIELDGGLEITERGVVYSKSQNPTIEESAKVIYPANVSTFACEINELEVVTTYYARAYAINEKGVSYGEQIEFTTLSTIATLGEVSTTNVAATTATFIGKILSDGGAPLTARGFCFSRNKEPKPNLEDSVLIDSVSVDSIFTCHATNLYGGATYYLRAFATNANGTVFTEPITFVTEKSIPVVITYQPTNVSYTIATVGGKIEHNGGTKVTERGVCYATHSIPTIADTKVINTASAAAFTCNLKDLQDETTYYVCTYAINEIGVAYGNVESFTTKAAIPPTVETTNATNIYAKSATVGGNVTDDGGAKVTERGIVYNTTKNPIIDSTKVVGGEGKGTFTCEITGLKDGVTYYARAYAINKKDTVYGKEISFTTVQMKLPTIETASPTNISYTTVTLGGNVTDEGGAQVTERGFVYSTSENPVVDSTKIVCGEGAGEFTYELTDLQDATTYYVRAYAINEKGTSYGKERTFKTKTIVAPTVSTTKPTNIAYYSATIGGNVTDDGGTDVTERGVVYATEKNPTIDNNKITSDSGLGEYTCELTDLQDGTTYYARAYATNARGTAYGEQVNFTTADMADAVDLGLSVKWASYNLGANAPEDLGDYYAWGEIQPKENYDWSNYKWGNAEAGRLTKYNWSSDYGTPDYNFMLDPEDDAATVNWGGKWRMPTKEEFDELMTKCTWESVLRNGVCGREVTAPNGNKIFLPVKETSPNEYWTAIYWSSVLGTDNAHSAWDLLMWGYSPNDNAQCSNQDWRSNGALVRPVYDEVGAKADKPTIVTQTSMQVTKNAAVVGGNVTDNGGASILECGVVYGTSSSLTLSNTKIKSDRTELGDYNCMLRGLKENTKYYFRAYAVNREGIAYGSVESFTTQAPAAATPEAVDIGLSVKWATFNVGATKPEEYGDYFAWGETEPKEVYNWSTYKWGDAGAGVLTKYSFSMHFGFIDNKQTLDPEDDAATANWGGKWRMPTKEEQNELCNNCTWKWTTRNGIYGQEIMGRNGQTIFLPAAGVMDDNRISVGSNGEYWSNSLQTETSVDAHYIRVNSDGVGEDSGYYRCLGRSVRAVYGEPITINFPSVEMHSLNDVTDVFAIFECEITDDGGSSVTERGVVYSTSDMPTTSSNKVTSGTGTGYYSCQLTNLQPSTAYYVRAYAINERGVSYSRQVRFMTTAP